MELSHLPYKTCDILVIGRTWKRFLFITLLIAGTTSVCQAQSPPADVYSEIESLQRQLDRLKERQGLTALPPVVTTGIADQPMASYREYVNEQVAAPCWCKPNGDSKYPSVRLTGFFQADAGWFNQDAANMAAVSDIQDGADFRRARLAAVGDAWNNVSYLLEMDFAFSGRPSFMDVWLELQDIGPGKLRIGQFRHPFGMDGLTSVKEMTFLERGLPFAFLPFRQIGMMYYGNTESELATWAISGFRFPTDSFGGNVGDNGGFGLASRFTGLLLDHGDEGILHIGGGYCFIDPSTEQLRYGNQPEFFVTETFAAGSTTVSVPPFVDTDTIATQNFQLFNAELAASRGSFYAQSEVFYSQVNQIGGPDLAFMGSYAYAAYLLTGEHRPYNRKAGVFGTVDPLSPFGPCGWGAWEVAGRWSYIDLNDQNVAGGRLNNVTFGLNWYLNKYTKFQFNYIHAFLGTSPAVNGPIVNDSEADILAFRAQVAF